jgi:hypothetical protein
MPIPAEPYVNIQTGAVYGTITSGGTFSWYNPTAANCTVSNVGSWCTESSYGPIPPGASVFATVKPGLVPGNYPFTCPCTQVGQPSIHISGR